MMLNNYCDNDLEHNYYPINLEYYNYLYSDHLNYSKLLLNDLIPKFESNNIKSVLDACCGNGNDVVYLSKRGFNINASDLCKNMVGFTKNRFNQTNINHSLFFTSNVLELSKTCNQKFDLVLFRGNTLGHLNSFEQIKAIDELISVTNSNGIILLDYRNGLDYFNSKNIYEQRGYGVDKRLSNLYFSYYKIRFPKDVSKPYLINSHLYVYNYLKFNFTKYSNLIEANYVLKESILKHISNLNLNYEMINTNLKGLPHLETILIYNNI